MERTKVGMIPELRMPSQEELRSVCSAEYDRAAATYIDNWPAEWLALSMDTRLVALPTEGINEMWGAHDGLREFPVLSELAREVDDALNWHERFIRLNTRSPKDVKSRPITCAGRQAIQWIMGSERTMDDLSMLLHAKRPAFIALRQQVYISKPSELRCFVRDGELVSVSQYFCDQPQAHWQNEEHRKEAWDAIETFWRACVHPPSAIASYIFDVALRRGEQPLLIEVNPYGLSDPCAAETYANIERGGFHYVKDTHTDGNSPVSQVHRNASSV